ncbi:unnamed protein product [Prorocentrum cordatum]|uniref:RNA-directed RNA polymerase n=1 Tax=Prorocentrum cordatum TaxID=2364126 RepID=A0ABN9U0U1_9DINO|nr:unnamed protein product [Polarella glacialis]
MTECTKLRVIEDLDKTADAMAVGLRRLRLRVPGETKLVASSDELGVEFERRLVKNGIIVQCVRATVDLGSDNAAGRKRATVRMIERRARDAYEALAFRARSLRSGCSARASCPPPSSTLLSVRRVAAASAAGAEHGRCCLATVLQAVYGVAGRGIDMRGQLLKEWVALWLAQPALHPRIFKAWPQVFG